MVSNILESLDEEKWVTMNGTHVLVDDKGTPKSGEVADKIGNKGSVRKTINAKESVAMEKNPDKPKKLNFRACNKEVDSVLKNIGGEHWSEITNDSDVYRFSGRKSPASVATDMSNNLRKAGYKTVFWTPSGKMSEKPTSHFSVMDSKEDSYKSFDIEIEKDRENSEKGSSFLYISRQTVL